MKKWFAGLCAVVLVVAVGLVSPQVVFAGNESYYEEAAPFLDRPETPDEVK